MNEHFAIDVIISKYPDLSEEEKVVLENWLDLDNNKEIFQSILSKRFDQDLKRIDQLKALNDDSWIKFNTRISKYEKTKIINWWRGWRLVAAACTLSILGIGGYMWYRIKDESSVAKVHGKLSLPDIEPGSFKAKLILADGSSVLLDTTKNGELSQQGDATIVSNDGHITYRVNASQTNTNSKEVIYNTLLTSLGQTFSTVLSDGSRVWLNAESSIKYPVVFNEKERRVSITGEVYFEVSKSKSPFIVEGTTLLNRDKWTVEVLGTHFNINAYQDERAVQTTLLEGAVRMSFNKNAVMLKPGQQANLDQSTSIKTINGVDVNQIIAWKNGFFQFNNEDLQSVMRKIARWYGVEVVYQTKISTDAYRGKLKRSSKLSELLSLLEQDQVHFRIEENKIIVY